MSFQWTLVAAFLYIEIALILLMLFLKPEFWRFIFRSRFMEVVLAQSHIYFVAFIAILFLFFIESVREFHKYSGKMSNPDRLYSGSAAFYEDQMRLFRGQRNFYISGFAMLSVVIIRGLLRLFDKLAQLKAESVASMAQARSATNAAQQHMASAPVEDDGDSSENEKLRDRIKELEEKLKKSEKDLIAMKRQADSTNKAFDEVAEKLRKIEGSSSKKD